MTKKQYLILGITPIIFIIIIGAILLIKPKQTSWLDEIINSNNYTITLKDCNNNSELLEDNIINNIKDKSTNISDNGPWTGDTNTCYKIVEIEYDINDVVRKARIIILNNNEIAIDMNNNTTYYTNAKDLVDYLNSL